MGLKGQFQHKERDRLGALLHGEADSSIPVTEEGSGEPRGVVVVAGGGGEPEGEAMELEGYRGYDVGEGAKG